MTLHTLHYLRPYEQKHIIRSLFMIPIYCCTHASNSRHLSWRMEFLRRDNTALNTLCRSPPSSSTSSRFLSTHPHQLRPVMADKRRQGLTSQLSLPPTRTNTFSNLHCNLGPRLTTTPHPSSNSSAMVRCISPRGSLITVALVQWAFEFHQRLLTIRRAKYLDYTHSSKSIYYIMQRRSTDPACRTL
jgi:hypothetical protein